MARLLLLLLAMVALVVAQDRPSGVGPAVMGTPSTALTTAVPTTSSTKTSSSTGVATHTIKVGPRGNPHQYVPHSVNATVGDYIVFEFYPRNHSVVQAKYLEPCVPAAKDIFYSGPFNNFNEGDGFLDGPAPTWTLRVNNTEPTFFYCTAIDSCNVNGMVGAINPNETMTWEEQNKYALDSPIQLVPGEPVPAEGSDNTLSDSSSSSSSKLSGGAIAGIVVGAVAFVAILMTLFFVLGRNRVYKQWMSSQDGRAERTARWAFFNNGTSAPATAPSEVRKSEYDLAFQPTTADHQSGMFVASPEMTHAVASAPPPLQQSMPVAGHWSWDLTAHQQQQQYPPPPPPPPVELDSESRK